MPRQSRTFKLRLSPAGMDLLIDSHCHLIRSTRSLLAWGTTLAVAVDYLDTVPTHAVIEQLAILSRAGLIGGEEHHLGAPKGLNLTAMRIAERVTQCAPDCDTPTLSSIYMVALRQITRADPAALRATYERMRPCASRAATA